MCLITKDLKSFGVQSFGPKPEKVKFPNNKLISYCSHQGWIVVTLG